MSGNIQGSSISSNEYIYSECTGVSVAPSLTIIVRSSGKIEIDIQSGTSSALIIESTNVIDGNWHFVVYTDNGDGNGKLYIDTNLEQNAVYTESVYGSTTLAFIGYL